MPEVLASFQVSVHNCPAVSHRRPQDRFTDARGTNGDGQRQVCRCESLTHDEGLIIQLPSRKLDYQRVFPGKDMKPVQRLGRDNAIKR